MMKKINFNKFIFFNILDHIFLLFILYTLFVAVRSRNLEINLLHEYVFAMLLILILILNIIFYSSTTKDKAKLVMQKLFNIGRKNKKLITIIIFFITILLQFIVIYYTTTPISWDVGAIFNGVTELPESPERMSSYLSENPNNSFFSFFMYGITQMIIFLIPNGSFGDTWLSWQLLNAVFLDVGFVTVFLAARKLFNSKVAYIAYYLSFIPLALSPWILVPYTDVIIIPVIGLIFYLYACFKSNNSLLGSIIILGSIGVMCAISFLLKPSSIIFLIAWFIIEALRLFVVKISHINLVNLFFFIGFTFCFIGTISLFNYFENNQETVIINEEKAKPWLHFVNMGLKDEGGFNIEDTKATRALPNQDAKKEYAKSEIIKRLKGYGALGYLQFLMEKHKYNTDRGDFGWGVDGGQQNPESSPKNRLAIMLRDTYYQASSKTDNIRFFMQIFWIITLIGLIFSSRIADKNFYTEILKLGILGAFLFLLLFEGGRSRYLIQFLPMFYILSAYGWNYKIADLLNKKRKN